MSDDILRELRAIRSLLEWQKEDSISKYEEMKKRDERVKEEWRVMNEEMNNEILEKTKQNALEVYRQAQREHEQRYHGAKPATEAKLVS